jgi:RNA polymerase sigma-70 factor (ECF subfamily)
VGGPEEPEEIVQEAFLRLFQQFDEKGERTQMRRWVFRVAHNLAMDQYRRQKRFTLKSQQEWMDLSDTLQDMDTTPEERLLEEERIALLVRSMAILTNRQAQCLNLRIEGLSYREIADLLGISISTVAGTLRLAILKIRESK